MFQDAEAVAKDDVQKVLGAADEYKRRWNSTWEEQERRLRQNLQICQFNFDLRQVTSLHLNVTTLPVVLLWLGNGFFFILTYAVSRLAKVSFI